MSGIPDKAKPSVQLPAARITNLSEEGNDKPANSALADVLRLQNQFERQHALERLGYERAKRGVHVAFADLSQIPSRLERAAFLRGAFAQLSEGSSADALRALKAMPAGPDRIVGLTVLVENWQPEAAFEAQRGNMALNLENSEASLIARLLGNPSLAVACARELLSGKERLQIISSAAFEEASRDPKSALSLGSELQGEDRAQFLEAVARGWARSDGASALAWVLEEPDPVVRERLHRETLLSWGANQPEAALERLSAISDPSWRQEALAKIASEWAVHDTRAALEWANGLADPQQHEQALTSIQQSAPVGIGVVLNVSDGLPNITEVLPGSSASAGGILKPGYRIAAIGDGRGGFIDLQGIKLDEASKLIRGKSGTSVALQVIPPGGTFANRVTVMVPRQQLLFKTPPPAPKP